MSKTNIAEQKQELRRRVQAALRDLSPADIAHRSHLISARLFESRFWQRAETVYFYASLPREVQTDEIRRRAESEGRRVVLPRVSGRAMRFHDVTGSARPLERSAFGIEEPPADLPVIDPGAAQPGPGESGAGPPGPGDAGASLVLVPGLAFDSTGGRLGRGGGFYDRFLAAFRGRCMPVGLCLEVQVLESVPRTEGDMGVCAVITEQRILPGM